ncbi:MAG: hypothetical protein GY866_24870 [Proteobacteria bacterium]|nr:hypothetical protein [Pseudomonadota bacterium]
MKAWLNGNFVDWNEINVSPLSHSFSRGFAIFEVVDIVPTLKGSALFGLKQHVTRFFNSARLVDMELPLGKDDLIQAVVETAYENKVSAGISKFFAYYPDIELRLVPEVPKASIAIYSIDFKDFDIDPQEWSKPKTAGISSFRKNHPESVPPHAKVAGNYVNPYLAQMDVLKKGYDEAILLDTMGFVAEGPTCNTFFIKNRKVTTPNLRSALPGITRLAAIEALREMKYVVEEKDIRPEEILACDEAFFSSSVLKIDPIRSIEGRKLGDACPGPVTTVLINKMNEIYGGKIEMSRKWLTEIE